MQSETAAGIERPFGFWTATSLVMGGMIGAGIFVLPAQLAPYGATAGAGWVVGIIGAALLGLTIGALVQHRPQATGLLDLCSDGLGNGAAVLMGWAYWVSIGSTAAVLALAAAGYLAVIVPGLGQSSLRLAICALALIWAITLMTLAGPRAAGRFQVLTAGLKLLPLLVVVLILAGLALSGGRASFSAAQQPPLAVGQISSVLNLVFYALVGFESAAIAAERVRDPARIVPKATLIGTGLVGALYLLVSTGIAYAMPHAELVRSSAPIADFVTHQWGHMPGQAVAAFAAISAIGCLSAWILIAGEVPLGMARSGLLPPALGRTNRHGVAWQAVLGASLLGTVLVVSNLSRGTTALFDFMMRLTSATNLVLYVGVCLVALRARVRPVLATLGLAFTGWALWGSGLEVAAWSGLLLLTALPLHLYTVRTAKASG